MKTLQSPFFYSFFKKSQILSGESVSNPIYKDEGQRKTVSSSLREAEL